MCEVGSLIKIYQRGCSLTRAAVLHEDKNKTTGKESKQAPRIRVKTVHTVKVSSINAPHVGTNSPPLLLFYMCAKFTSIIKIFIVEIAKSTALQGKRISFIRF